MELIRFPLSPWAALHSEAKAHSSSEQAQSCEALATASGDGAATRAGYFLQEVEGFNREVGQRIAKPERLSTSFDGAGFRATIWQRIHAYNSQQSATPMSRKGSGSSSAKHAAS